MKWGRRGRGGDKSAGERECDRKCAELFFLPCIVSFLRPTRNAATLMFFSSALLSSFILMFFLLLLLLIHYSLSSLPSFSSASFSSSSSIYAGDSMCVFS